MLKLFSGYEGVKGEERTIKLKKVLIVHDEEKIGNKISHFLSLSGYEWIKAFSGETMDVLENKVVDLVLLDSDSMMSEMDGWNTCREIRKYYNTPIIILSAKGEKLDIIKGLKMGADDYITKPFDEEVLVARIEAVVRRGNLKQTNQIKFNGLIWHSQQYVLNYQAREIHLTPKEFEMIGLFLKNQQTAFSRKQLIEMIWGLDSKTEERTIDSHIRNIRDKCRKAGFPIDNHLKTLWGVGYKLI